MDPFRIGQTNPLKLKSRELFHEDLLAVDRPIFTAIKIVDLHG